MAHLVSGSKREKKKVAQWWESLSHLYMGKLDCIVEFPEEITDMQSNTQ